MAERVAIIGVGQMGTGIAQACLQSGHSVVLLSRSQESLERGMARLKAGMLRSVEKGKLAKVDMDSFLSRVTLSVDMAGMASASIVIESVPEVLDTKLQVMKEMEKFSSTDAILATNTSSIMIDRLASALSDPSRFIGLHFFNPANVMKLVEVVIGSKTSNGTLERSMAFVAGLNKTPVKVKDSPGFVSNRILMAFINESIMTLEDGVADASSIDTVAKLGFNHPMGPIELADFIGLDVCKDIMEAIYAETKNKQFMPAPLLSKLVSEGKLGRKTGEGLYKYVK